MDEQIEKRFGQDVIDSLSVLEAVIPTFDTELSQKFIELFPHVALALRSRFAIVRQSAARCFATVCDALSGCTKKGREGRLTMFATVSRP